MNRRVRLRIGLVLLALLVAGMGKPAIPAASAESAPAASCATPEYRQFDFWAGDWDAYDFGTPTIAAHVRVDRILGNCVLREDYEGVDGHRGRSFSIYDASRRVWHQTWVTNRGHLLMIDGQFRNGEMVLTGSNPANDAGARDLAAGGGRRARNRRHLDRRRHHVEAVVRSYVPSGKDLGA